MQRNDGEILKKYNPDRPAQGPEGLKQALEDLFVKSQQDPAFTGREHFIYYKIGEQESLIKVDMSEKPVLIWYFDLFGRPATPNVKKVVSDFLWEKFSQKEQLLEISPVKVENHGFVLGEVDEFVQALNHYTIRQADEILNFHNRENYAAHAKGEFFGINEREASKGWMKTLSLFRRPPEALPEKENKNHDYKPTNKSR